MTDDQRERLHSLLLDCLNSVGVSDGTKGWIRHSDQDGTLRCDSLSLEGELIFGFEAIGARIDEMGKDAARYRWWRNLAIDETLNVPFALREATTPEEMDAAIDEAMQSKM